MAKLNWTPWHKVVRLRDDVRSAELSLAEFAADLYDVAIGSGKRPLYEDPARFFALTFPTLALRDLAKDVVLRLAAKNTKAIRQLELTYGGGKTHTLITLFHLANDPGDLPSLPAVEQFKSHIGIPLPRARIAALCFDKLDVEKGMEVRGPDGEKRWLKQPWSLLAFQIAGSDGLRVLSADGTDRERETPPAEPLLVTLLSMPQAQDLSTLILIDEVLMFARQKVISDPKWRSLLVDFFQYLCQAVAKVDRCAMVASLLASDPDKSDEFGKELISEIYQIFGRQREEGVQPVQKEDVAEVLRRRFFEPESIANQDNFRQHVTSAVENIAALDESVRKSRGAEEARFLRSYPFHPDLTEIFYVRWTQLDKFQRTRGILRTFALALRDAERWDDPSPLVAANVFLPAPTVSSISEALAELAGIVTREKVEGSTKQWSFVLQGEFEKARTIQGEQPALKFREIEQAVCNVFLSSQPIGQKAHTADLVKLLSATRPDRIELEKGLRRWTEISWFLDEAEFVPDTAENGAAKALPKAWRLGDRPNLKQMHHAACRDNIGGDFIEQKLLSELQATKSLTQGAKGAGASVHTLPERPRDVEDDGAFHFAILGPKAVSDSGKPSAEARRFIDETTAADRPRTRRNAVVLVAPSRDGLEAARNRIRDYLGWEEVRDQLKDQKLDVIRQEMLARWTAEARGKIPEMIRQAWCIVVAVNEQNDVQAFKVTIGSEPLFATIKADKRARILDAAISAEAMLPGGPYDLWREDEASRRVKDIIGAFAENPRLPRMLEPNAIFQTIDRGVQEGIFVASVVRPDKSVRTIWREPIDLALRNDPALELFLPQKATLSVVPWRELTKGVLPELWSGDTLSIGDAIAYFAGGRTVTIDRGGFAESMGVPAAAAPAVEAAVAEAVRRGVLWLVNGPASFQSEDVPPAALSANAILRAPHPVIPYDRLLPDHLPAAWKDGAATALSISLALSNAENTPLPWSIVRQSIEDAVKMRWLALADESSTWPCDYAGAASVVFRLPDAQNRSTTTTVSDKETRPKGAYTGAAVLAGSALQDFVDVLPDFMKSVAGTKLRFRLEITLGDGEDIEPQKIATLNELLESVSKELALKR